MLFNNRKNWNNRLFAATSFVAGLWTFCNYMTGVFPTTIWLEATYATGALVMAFGFIWILYITRERISETKAVLIASTGFLFAILSFVKGFLVERYDAIYVGGVFTGRPAFGLFIYTALFCFSGFSVLYLLASTYKNSSNQIRRQQLQAVFLGALVTLSISGLTSFILPSFSIFSFGGLDSFSFLVFLLCVGYSIVRHNFFDIKIIKTEFLIFTLMSCIILRLIFSDSVYDLVLNIAVLLIALVVSFALSRSVRQEVFQREKLNEINIQKDELLSFASHQLRTPLTVISGYAGMLKAGEFGVITEKQKEIIGSMFNAVNNLSKLVGDFLNISRLEHGGLKYADEDFAFDVILQDVVDDMQLAAFNKNLVLSFENSLEKSLILKGDEDKLRESILNIVDNAIKYTSEGRVNISLCVEGGFAIATISDTGMGISPDLHDVIFQKFKRAHDVRTTSSGSGLGLYISKKIIEAHRGRVAVSSMGVGTGSKFTIYLPVE